MISDKLISRYKPHTGLIPRSWSFLTSLSTFMRLFGSLDQHWQRRFHMFSSNPRSMTRLSRGRSGNPASRFLEITWWVFFMFANGASCVSNWTAFSFLTENERKKKNWPPRWSYRNNKHRPRLILQVVGTFLVHTTYNCPMRRRFVKLGDQTTQAGFVNMNMTIKWLACLRKAKVRNQWLALISNANIFLVKTSGRSTSVNIITNCS